MEDAGLLKRAFETVQELIADGRISAGHDCSDGGRLSAILEMAFAGGCGLDLDLVAPEGVEALSLLFAEELGLVLEVAVEQVEPVLAAFQSAQVPCALIGASHPEPAVRVRVNQELVLEDDIRDLRDLWEATSFALDRLQADPACVAEEQRGLRHRTGPSYGLTFTPRATPAAILDKSPKIPVCILREEGSNSDREMASAFAMAGFEPWDVTMSDLLAGRIDLQRFRGLAAVGGFSYADVLDSGKGWAGVIRFNQRLREQCAAFLERPDTFSLGVCNGCQLLALLGWVPWQGIPDPAQPRFIRNTSGRFESRFSTVRIMPGPALMLRGMAGSTMGIWLNHGEGRAHFPDESILYQVLDQDLAPIRFVDDSGRITEAYPFNPNGSSHGIAALTSADGRHLAVMPHPERSFLKWQLGWMPEHWRRELAVSPWLQLFQNAYTWCTQE